MWGEAPEIDTLNHNSSPTLILSIVACIGRPPLFLRAHLKQWICPLDTPPKRSFLVCTDCPLHHTLCHWTKRRALARLHDARERCRIYRTAVTGVHDVCMNLRDRVEIR